MKLVPAFIVSSLALALGVACGPSQCARGQDALKRFGVKAGKCVSGAKLRTFSLSTCDSVLGTCSPADAADFDKYLACLDKVPECDPAKPADFKAAADACELTADAVKLSCGAGLGT